MSARTQPSAVSVFAFPPPSPIPSLDVFLANVRSYSAAEEEEAGAGKVMETSPALLMTLNAMLALGACVEGCVSSTPVIFVVVLMHVCLDACPRLYCVASDYLQTAGSVVQNMCVGCVCVHCVLCALCSLCALCTLSMCAWGLCV